MRTLFVTYVDSEVHAVTVGVDGKRDEVIFNPVEEQPDQPKTVKVSTDLFESGAPDHRALLKEAWSGIDL